MLWGPSREEIQKWLARKDVEFMHSPERNNKIEYKPRAMEE